MNRTCSHLLRSVLMAGLSVGVLASQACAMVIVRDGKPNATICVAPNASEQVKQAAATLQEYILKSSGAKLPISETTAGNSIIVGKSADVDTSKIDEDGFILQGVNDKNYVISGGSDWGTEFGVYDFLERYVGVRWLMPTDLGTDIPQHQTLDIPETKIVQNPVYLSRQLSPINIASEAPLGKWGRYNRARGRIAFHHNLLHLFPVSKFGKTHPEFYPILNGKRYIPQDDDDWRWQPNFSAPGIVDAAVEQIEKYFSEHPEATSYSLGMNDSNLWDQSDASKARRNGKKNYLGLEDISDDYFTWANAVVEKVLLKYPDKWFGTLAYNGIAEPPTKVGVHPRIVPFITYDRMRWEDPQLREFGQQLTLRWEKVSPVLGWYDYAYGISYQLPRVYPHRMQKYLDWGAAHHVNFSYAEIYPNWGEGPKPWVFEKLLWNPEQNVDELLSDWYRHFAGEKAAPKLAHFYSIWEKFWTVDIYKSKWNTQQGQYLPFGLDPSYLLDVPESYISQSDADFAAALQLADTPQRKARVAKLKEMWDFYKASILVYQGDHRALHGEVQTESQALDLLDNAEKVMAQVQRRKALLASFADDPLYKLSAQYIARYPATAGTYWGSSLLWRILPWGEKSPQVKTRLEQLAQSNDPVMSHQTSLILQTLNGENTLVSANDSFEDGTKGWELWDKNAEESTYHKGTWEISTEQAHSGKQSLSIQGLGRGAPLQSIPYAPGTYLAKVHCYVPSAIKKGTANLTLSALGNNKIALPSGNVPLQPGVWSSIVIPFTVPEDATHSATKIRLLLLLVGFEPDEKIYIDDIGIYKIGE